MRVLGRPKVYLFKEWEGFLAPAVQPPMEAFFSSCGSLLKKFFSAVAAELFL